MKRLTLNVLLGFFLTLAMLQSAFAAPSGYVQVQSATGWKLYYNSSENVYVQEVNLSLARLEFRCTNNNNVCDKIPLISHWLTAPANSYAVVNGQFFDSSNPANLALAVTNRYYSISQGYESSNTSNQRMLLLKESTSSASVVSGFNFATMANADGAILGFNPDVNKNKLLPIGRTFIGVSNNGGTIFIFSAYAKTQNSMVNIATSFGVLASNLIMLDGSGSAQIRTSNYWMNGSAGTGPDNRTIPQVIYTVKK